jgi:pimeloyl-[acyl-carrier protein] methyl ester esterase
MFNLTIKPNLILLHGWAFNSAIWQPTINFLSEYYNLITIDLNGHGHNNFNSDYQQLDNYLDALIQQIPFNSHILGWSLGGNIALNLKYKYPDHINKIMLCCSNPCFLTRTDWSHGINPKILAKFTNNLLIDPNKTIKEFLLLQTMNHTHAKTLYKNLLEIVNNAPSPSSEGLKWGLNILEQDYLPLLNIIEHCDIKFILGAKDSLVPKTIAHYLTDNHQNIEVTVLDKSGHVPFITEPDDFYRTLINNLK